MWLLPFFSAFGPELQGFSNDTKHDIVFTLYMLYEPKIHLRRFWRHFHFLPPFLDASTHLYRRVCPSVHPSIHPSVHPSVGRLVSYNCAKIVSLSWFGHDELLYWSKWSTNIFWEPYLQLGCSTRLSVHLSFHICHMINHCRKLMILETMLYSV